MHRQLLHLSLASYWRNKAYSALVLLTLIVACAGLTAVQMINASAKQSYRQASQPLLTGVTWRIVSQDDKAPLTKSDYAHLRRQGFTQLVPILTSTQILAYQDKRFRIELIGIDAFALLGKVGRDKGETLSAKGLGPEYGLDWTLDGNGISQLWQSPYAALLHPNFLAEIDIPSGAQMRLKNGKLLPKLATLNSHTLSREILLDIGVLQALLGQSNLSALLVTGELSEQAQSKLSALLPEHLSLQSFNTQAEIGQLTDSFHLNLTAMAMLMFAVCLFVVMNAMNLLLAKRIGNYRICRQLGISQRHIQLNLLIELLSIAFICALVGSLAGVGLAQWLSPAVNKTLYYLYDVRIGFNQASLVNLFLQSLIASVIGTLIAALLPSMMLNHQLAAKPERAMRQTSYLWLFTGVILLLCALVLALVADSLALSFALIACLLLAGCCLLIALQPKILSALVNLSQRTREQYPLWYWAQANNLALADKSKIAFCAFFIAVSANIGMHTMVGSFRQATLDWLETRLVGSHYVYCEDAKACQAPLLEQSTYRLVPRYQAQASAAKAANKAQAELHEVSKTSIEIVSYPSVTDYWQALALESEWQAARTSFTAQTGVLVNQQLSARLSLQVGDYIELNTPTKSPLKRQIVGIYYDYGNPKSQLLMPLESWSFAKNSGVFAGHFSERELVQFQTWLETHTLDVNLLAKDELLANAMRTFDRTFIITDNLRIITLLVAAISLATSILLIARTNQQQQSLLRVLGVPAWRMLIVRLGQFLQLGLLAAIFAIPFGQLLSWVLVSKINWLAFQWRYPLIFDATATAQILLLCLAIVLLAVLVPLLKDYRVPLQKALKS